MHCSNTNALFYPLPLLCDLTADFSKSLRVYSSVYSGKPSLEEQDKIILPEAVLPLLQHSITAGVITLELTNTTIGKPDTSTLLTALTSSGLSVLLSASLSCYICTS